jgi:hypothetical protein
MLETLKNLIVAKIMFTSVIGGSLDVSPWLRSIRQASLRELVNRPCSYHYVLLHSSLSSLYSIR